LEFLVLVGLKVCKWARPRRCCGKDAPDPPVTGWCARALLPGPLERWLGGSD
jgi:hypothetical protein